MRYLYLLVSLAGCDGGPAMPDGGDADLPDAGPPTPVACARDSEGSYTTGLVLDRLDDILLRMDYVSVAR